MVLPLRVLLVAALVVAALVVLLQLVLLLLVLLLRVLLVEEAHGPLLVPGLVIDTVQLCRGAHGLTTSLPVETTPPLLPHFHASLLQWATDDLKRSERNWLRIYGFDKTRESGHDKLT